MGEFKIPKQLPAFDYLGEHAYTITIFAYRDRKNFAGDEVRAEHRVDSGEGEEHQDQTERTGHRAFRQNHQKRAGNRQRGKTIEKDRRDIHYLFPRCSSRKDLS